MNIIFFSKREGLARQLNLPYRFDAAVWFTGVLGTTLIVAASGWLATRSVLNHSPRAVLN